jgi:hypothetical protein
MHTLAVNDTGVVFVNTARERGDECGPLAWRHEIAHPIAPGNGKHPRELVVADALLTYTQQNKDRTLSVHQCFIELDRATIPVPALTEKFVRYTRLQNYTPPQAKPGASGGGGWRDYYNEFPRVLVLLAHRDRETLERRLQNTIALHQTTRQTRGASILLGLFEDLCQHGPFAEIFIDPENPEHYVNWLGEHQQES